MPMPPKTYLQLVKEGKSHRTKAELEQRKQWEDKLLAHVEIKEFKDTKKNKIAHKEFKRIVELMGAIEKNDDLFAGVLNRYCMLKAECNDFEEKREIFTNNLNDLKEQWENQKALNPEEREMSLFDYFKLQSSMQSNIIALDKQIMNKRKMMLDIEKENLMTISGALRSIPKKVTNDDGDKGKDPFDMLFNQQ